MNAFEERLNDLLVDVFNNITKIEERTLRQSKIPASISEVHLIDAIGKHGSVTIGELAAELGISSASVTVAVNKLKRRGFLEKERRSADKRTVDVTLTEMGLRVHRLHRYFHRRMVRNMTKELSKEEQKVLMLGVEKIDEFFRRSTEE